MKNKHLEYRSDTNLLALLSKKNHEKYQSNKLLWNMMLKPVNIRIIKKNEFHAFSSNIDNQIFCDQLFEQIILPFEPYLITNGEFDITEHNLLKKIALKINKQDKTITIDEKTIINIDRDDFKFELLLRTISIRMVMEIDALSVEFPFRKIDSKTAESAFKDLKAYVPKTDCSSSFVGMAASDIFLRKERYKVPRDGSGAFGPIDHWNKRESLPFNFRKTVKKEFEKKGPFLINNTTLIKTIDRDNAVDKFQPAIVLDVIALLHSKFPNFKPQSVFDPCGGWGDRLLAFLAANMNSIVYNDVNSDLKNGYEQIISHYATPEQKNNTRLLFKPAEDLVLTDICPNTDLLDFVFTGVPYFKKERYLGENQSHARYHKVNDWFNGFLFKMTAIAAAAIKTSGFMVINIDDVNLDTKGRFLLVKPLEDFLDTLSFVRRLEGGFKLRGAFNSKTKEFKKSSLVMFQRLDKPYVKIEFPLTQVAPHRTRTTTINHKINHLINETVANSRAALTSLLANCDFNSRESSLAILEQIKPLLSIHNQDLLAPFLIRFGEVSDPLTCKQIELLKQQIEEKSQTLKCGILNTAAASSSSAVASSSSAAASSSSAAASSSSAAASSSSAAASSS
ncbi:MAG: hypothetical protein PSV35_10765, partial [bacterium]|nr:hypothetical protein [bacterium]